MTLNAGFEGANRGNQDAAEGIIGMMEVIKEGGVRVYLPSDGPNSDHFVTEIPGPDNSNET